MIDWGISFDLSELTKIPVSGLHVIVGNCKQSFELIKSRVPYRESSVTRSLREKFKLKTPEYEIEYDLRISGDFLLDTGDPMKQYVSYIFEGLKTIFQENTDIPPRLFDKSFNLAWYTIRKDPEMIKEFEEGINE
jgi:hypothetical protein